MEWFTLVKSELPVILQPHTRTYICTLVFRHVKVAETQICG